MLRLAGLGLARRGLALRATLAGRPIGPRLARDDGRRLDLLLDRLLGARRTLGAGLAMLAARTARTLGRTAAAATAASAPATAATAAVGGLEGDGFHARHHDARDLRADQLLDRLDQAAFVGRGQGEGMTDLAGAAGTADAMDVVLGRERHVEVEDVAHVDDVEAAGGDVGGHQDLDLALLELLERLHARRLAHVAVQRAGVEALLLERGMQGGDVALAVAEHEGVLDVLLPDQPDQRLALLLFRHDHDALDDVGAGGGRRRHGDFLRVLKEAVGQPLDLGRHGGGEEQRLAQLRQVADDALDVGDEAHVEHAIGFVDHQHLDVVQQHLAALEMVEQAARRGDQHVDALLERALLVVEAHAADQQRHAELVVLAVDVEVLGHLGGQFTRRLQDQRARHAHLATAFGQDVDHREDEGGGLAGARLGASEDIAAHQDDGDGLFLDRGGRRVALFGNRLQYGGAQPQTLKIHLSSVT